MKYEIKQRTISLISLRSGILKNSFKLPFETYTTESNKANKTILQRHCCLMKKAKVELLQKAKVQTKELSNRQLIALEYHYRMGNQNPHSKI